MGMRKTTIRLSDKLWHQVQAAADEEDIPAAQYIREALIARLFYDQGLRGEPFGAPVSRGEEDDAEQVARRAHGSSQPTSAPK